MKFGINPYLVVVATTLFLPVVVEAVVCCATCEDNSGFGLGSMGFPVCADIGTDSGSPILPAQTGTVEECKLMGFPGYVPGDGICGVTNSTCFYDPGVCQPTGAPPLGDCRVNSDCSDFNLEFGRRPLDYCIDEGAGYFQFFYNQAMCLSVDMACAKFQADYPEYLALFPDYCVFDPEVDGDPHFKLLRGSKWFDYHGECDLVFLHAPGFEAGKPLSIHVRTTIRYDYSYVEAAALALGDDVLEVASFGQHSVNGVGDVLFAKPSSMTVGGYQVHHSQPTQKQHIFDIVIGPSENITITTFKDIVSVKVKGGSQAHFGNSTGLLGNYKGETVGRDGSIVSVEETANAFGQEWQVKEDEPMLFSTARSPQAPQRCNLPQAGAAQKRRLGQSTISAEAAEAACAHLDGTRKENCIYDVMAVNDLDIAAAGAF